MGREAWTAVVLLHRRNEKRAMDYRHCAMGLGKRVFNKGTIENALVSVVATRCLIFYKSYF